MDQEVFIVGIVFASIILIVFLGVLGGMFKTWMNRNSSKNLSENQEFLAALREFKENTEQRLSNLEAIVADEEPVQKRAEKKQLPKKEQKSAIEIEIENEKKKEDAKESGDSGKLRNMLNQ